MAESSVALPPEFGSMRMSLRSHQFDPETIRLMGVAYEMALLRCGLLIAATLPTMSSRRR